MTCIKNCGELCMLLLYSGMCVRRNDPIARGGSGVGNDRSHSQHSYLAVADRRRTEDCHCCAADPSSSRHSLCHRAILQHAQAARRAVKNSAS